MVGLPVWSKPHDLVFVTELHEPEKLSDGEIDETERMREIGSMQHLQPVSAAFRPRGADEIAESVDGADGCVFKRRDKERAGQMRRMMLYPVNAAPQFVRIDTELPCNR